MKVIITGATGLVRAAVVRRCINDDKIRSIVILSRRELPPALTASPKVNVILHEDFLDYPSTLLEQLEGAEACFWALGLRGAPIGYSDLAYARKVDVEFPVAAAKAFAGTNAGRRFRFVLCSGIFAEQDQEKPLGFILRDTKRIKGLAEKSLKEVAETNEGFEVFTCRPFGIVPEESSWLVRTFYYMVIPKALEVTELAATMVDLGVSGSLSWIWEHEDIQTRGAKLLSEK